MLLLTLCAEAVRMLESREGPALLGLRADSHRRHATETVPTSSQVYESLFDLAVR